MDGVFPEQFAPNDECMKSIWANAFFVFDTNILLNLYRHSVTTRDALFEVMDHLKGRLFLPHQVGLEFFRHREATIAQQIDAFEMVRKHLSSLPSQFRKTLTRHPSIPIEKIAEALSNVVDQCIGFIHESQSANGENFLLHPDPVLSRLNSIFKECSQGIPTDLDWKALDKSVQDRVAAKMAPCFTTSTNATNPHEADGYVWFQIVGQAIALKKPVIFVTADAKENWWRMTKIGNSVKPIGPHFQLIKDIRNAANEHFLMYTQDTFLAEAPHYLELTTRTEAVDESRHLRESDADSVKATELGYSVNSASNGMDAATGNSVAKAMEQAGDMSSLQRAAFSSISPMSGLGDLAELGRNSVAKAVEDAMDMSSFRNLAELQRTTLAKAMEEAMQKARDMSSFRDLAELGRNSVAKAMEDAMDMSSFRNLAELQRTTLAKAMEEVMQKARDMSSFRNLAELGRSPFADAMETADELPIGMPNEGIDSVSGNSSVHDDGDDTGLKK